MTVRWPPALAELLDHLAAFPRPLREHAGEGRLNELSAALADFQHQLRERLHLDTAGEISRLADALEQNVPILPSDLEVLRLWLVGDAEQYLEFTHEYRRWLGELNRLLDVLDQLRRASPTPATFVRAGAVARDALRLATNVAHFEAEEERVRMFEQSIQQLTHEDKRMLASILRERLRPERM